MALTFDEARACVLREVPAAAACAETTEIVALADSDRRVLAERILADRDYPPFAKAVRDGFAVRAQDIPGELCVVGEVRAGEASSARVRAGKRWRS